MHRMKWGDLQFVHAVAELGSLSAASRALGVNHATVLRRIALLEAASNVTLFDRANDGYRPRPECRALLASLKLMDHAADRIRRSLDLTSHGLEGTFRLATTDAIACLLLPRHLAALRQKHPNINIEIAVSNDPIDLSMSGAEVLVRPGQGLPEDLSGYRAGSVAFGVFASASYLKESAQTSPQDQKWVGAAPDFAQTTAGEWQFSRNQAGFEVSADSFLTLANLAAEGMGLALLPEFVGCKTSGLVPVEAFSSGPETGIWVATHKDFRQQPDIEALLRFLAEALASDTGLKRVN